MARHHRHDRQRVENAAIDQHAVALHHRGKQAGNRCRGAHGLVQATFLEPDFLLVGQVGGNGGIGDAQVFDVDLADDLANLPEHLLATNRPQTKTDVHQAQHVEIVQALDPVAVIVEFAGGIDPAHHCAHGATGDTGNVIAAPFDLFNDPNMCVTPGSTRAQYQCDTLFHESPSFECFNNAPIEGHASTVMVVRGGKSVVFSTLHGGTGLFSSAL
ncbi:hypothetical protein D9M71_166220 [compost metagenome]